MARMYDRTGIGPKCTLIKTGFKNLRTGTEAKFRPFVDALLLGEFTKLFWPRSPKPSSNTYFWFCGQPNLKALGFQVSDYYMSIAPQLFSIHISIFYGNGFMTDKKPSCDGNVSKGSVCKVSWRLARDALVRLSFRNYWRIYSFWH